MFVLSAVPFVLLVVATQQSASTPSATSPTIAAPAPSYSGKWHESKDKTDELTLDETGDTVHLKEERDGKLVAEYTCKLDGKDCEFLEQGHKAKVSLWVNGNKLVELRTRGEQVTRRRFALNERGNTLQVEVMAMSSGGKTETLAYSRER